LTKFFCEIRYCSNPGCIVHRFAETINTFKEIKRFDGLGNLWHFAIGFEKIPRKEFYGNSWRKRQYYVMNKFFEELRKECVNIQSIRVMDFAFEGNMVYPHYHFGAIPIGAQNRRETLLKIQKVRIRMISRMRIKTPFHFQSFGTKNKEGVLSYLAKRSVGLYSYDQSKKVEYVPTGKGKLLQDIKNKKYFLFSDFLTKEQFLADYYNRPHWVTIGGLPRPHGSILTDSIPSECPVHGSLTSKDVVVEVIFEDSGVAKPPNLLPTPPDEVLDIEIVRIV